MGPEFLRGVRAVLQRSDGGCAHRNDPPFLSPGSIQGGGGLGGKAVVLGVQVYVLDALDADRLKGAQADVQGDSRDLDSAGANLVEDFRREVQARGGSRDRTP